VARSKQEKPTKVAAEQLVLNAQTDSVDKKERNVAAADEILLKPRKCLTKFKLRFSPYAWAKIRWIRDYCKSEIAGFGISSMEDPFYMEDFRTIKQVASTTHFEFDDNALNDYLTAMFEEGKQPGECMRLWVHTHPGDNFATPSYHDEQTFSDAFSNTDWAMMIIVDEGDNAYARLRIKSGTTRLQMIVPHAVDCQPPFKGVNDETAAEWKAEADENITRSGARFSYLGLGTRLLPTTAQQQWRQRYQTRQHYMDTIPPDIGVGDEYARYMEDLYGPRTAEMQAPAAACGIWEDTDMLMATEERVVQITTEKATGDVLVLLNNLWMTYDPDVTPLCSEGAVVHGANEIAEIPPKRCGELSWEADPKTGDGVPVYVSEVVDGFVQYFEDIDEATADQAAHTAESDVEEIDIEVVEGVKVGPSGP